MAYVKAGDHGLSLVERMRRALRRAAFEALYGPLAWAYDWVSGTFFLGQWRRWQRAVLPFLRGRRVLEVGMGTGNLQIDLLRAGYDAFGIDCSMPMLRQAMAKSVVGPRSSVAREQVEGVGNTYQGFGVRGGPTRTANPQIWRGSMGKMRVCRARAQALPFPDACFDSVVSTFPSDYIIEGHTLAEVRRVLRHGGRLVVVPAGWLNPVGARGRLFEAVARLVYGGGHSTPPDRHSIRRRLERSTWVGMLCRRLREAGFDTHAYLASNEQGTALVVVADLDKSRSQG
jgi:ubiquinone/menaquinone biosynthesis C-methylase UbiE